jgi:hypothetical protein
MPKGLQRAACIMCFTVLDDFQKEKVNITSLNLRESSLFLIELQNQAKHLSQLLKLFIVPP